MIGLLIYLVLLTCLILCVKKHLRSFLAGCTKDIVLIGTGVSLVFMAISISLDGLPRILSSLGIETANDFSILMESMEEIVELRIPLILVVSTVAFFNKTPNLHGTDR
jgi:hypothetical protein